MQVKTKLSLFDFTMIMVSFVIGMGIFRTPVNVAAAAPNPAVFFGAWLAGGLIAICGALTYAEIGSRFPVTGGYYKIFSYAYHPSIAFGVNCIILISNAASLAGVSLIGAEYIIRLFQPSTGHAENIQIAIAFGSIVLFYGINLLGLKMSAKTQNVLTIIKISMIVLLIAPLFFAAPPTITIAQTTHHPEIIEYLKAFGIGLVAVSFTYGGYQQSINFGEEVANPSKNILSINYAYYRVIGFDQLKSATGIAALMAEHIFGTAAGNILSVFLFLSVLAYVNVLLMSNPRVMQAMSEEKMLPAAFAKRTKKNAVLFTSLSVFASLCALIIFWAKTFDEILSFTIFLDCFGMVLSAATIFKLRKRTSHLNGSGIYQMKWFPVMPVIFITAYLFIAISIFIEKPSTGFWGIGILAAFIGIYFIINRVKSI
jgi:APA family basic amino acid/polyamine antiporter